jgi:hypothetical protein
MDESISIRVARSLVEVEALREVWERSAGHRDSDIDVFLMVVKSLPSVIRPHVISIYKGDKPESILIGRLEQKRLVFRAGYIALFRPRVRCLNFIYGAIRGNDSEKNIELLVHALIASLKCNEADLAMFEFVPEAAPLYQFVLNMPSFLSRDILPASQLHDSLTIPRSIDDVYRNMSKERRKHTKSYIKRLENICTGGVRIVCYRDHSDLECLFRDAEKIAKKTYQRGLGVGFADNPIIRKRLELGAEKGWLRAFVLYVGEIPCSFWIGMLYHGTFVSEYMGYDPEYRQYSPGIVLIIRVIEGFCNDTNGDNVEELDFGIGHAEYKRTLCSRTWREAVLFIFSPTIKGCKLKMMRLAARLIDATARTVLSRMDLLSLIKRAWRNHVALGKDDC